MGDFEDFSSKAGELSAPVKSLSKTRFGQKRERGDLRWQGWLMPASRGSAVRAIHFGRVVYADWLRGQGLLTIIDHGNGWMSLYGRNESLLKPPGNGWHQVRKLRELARVAALLIPRFILKYARMAFQLIRPNGFERKGKLRMVITPEESACEYRC